MKTRYFKDDIVLVMVEGAEAVAVVAVEKLNLILGEWYQDETAGIPWIPNIIGSKATVAALNYIAGYISNELSTIPEVTNVDITNLDFDPTTRKLTVKVTLTHEEEEIQLEQTYGV